LKKRARKGLEAVLPAHRDLLLSLVEALRTDPVPYRGFDVAKLAGQSNAYRVRVGDIRLVYRVDWDNGLVDIEFIGPRGVAYKGS